MKSNMSKMKSVMVSYALKPEYVAENEALIRKVFAELEGDKPEGMSHSVSRLADGLSFVHVAVSRAGEESSLMKLAASQRYLDGIKSRVAAPPVRVEMASIGHYDGIAQAVRVV